MSMCKSLGLISIPPAALLLLSCDLHVVDQIPATPEDDPYLPAPESASVSVACEALGYELATPSMDIGAGQADIALPTMTHRIEINSAPAVLDQTDTEYVLVQDVSAPNTAFEITADNVTLNLNGHRVTYGTEASPQVAYPQGTAGVKTSWAPSGVVIANGDIVQGAGPCTGDDSGRNCNPVMVLGGALNVEIGGLKLSYHTPDTNGIVCMSDGEIHHNTLIDNGNHEVINGIAAIQSSVTSIHHNKILGARHRGIIANNNSEVSYNEIHINSSTTNSYGVMAYTIQNFQIHHNKIYGSGVHPVGIGPVGPGGTDGHVYSNYVITENTRTNPNAANYSSAFRITTYAGGWCDRIEVNCNYFVVKGGNSHPNLEGTSWGRALWIGGLAAGNRADIHHNYVQALTSDPSKYHPAVAIVSQGYNDGLYVEDNTVVANHTMVALSDPYGNSGLGYPKLIRNRFVRKDNYSTYVTIRDRQREYWNVTGLFLDNSYENGAELNAATMFLLDYCTSNKTEVGVGRLVNGQTQIEYYITDDPETVAAGSASEPFGNCGFKVIP